MVSFTLVGIVSLKGSAIWCSIIDASFLLFQYFYLLICRVYMGINMTPEMHINSDTFIHSFFRSSMSIMVLRLVDNSLHNLLYV